MKFLNEKTFFGFLNQEKETIVGHDKLGNQTNVSAEFVSLARLCASYVNELNYYINCKERNTFSAVEMSVEDYIVLQQRVCDKLRRAAKKLLWLNGCCQRQMNESFLLKKIDMNNVSECAGCIRGVYSAICVFLNEKDEALEKEAK